MPQIRRRYLAAGRVQGIGYRWFVRDAAEKFAATGWVRNLPDGSVEVEAQAEGKDLSAFENELITGHTMARVGSLAAQELPVREGEEEFRIVF